MNILQNLEPKSVFKYFEEISQIPRGSGNEKSISDYLVSVAKKLNLEVIQDKALNVIIKKPGTEGYENSETVILQGHMDMVCEKNKGTDHDFQKDPLKLRVVDDMVYATNTTLGADNGIAVAYALAILESTDIPHPPIEVLITTDEETGMSGAMAISKEHINGKILLNLDNEEEGHLLVSCAGGIRSKHTLNVTLEDAGDYNNFLHIAVRGLKGGHSGMEINKERGNSNKIMGRILKSLLSLDYKLVSVNGGSKNNAIPREADAIIALKSEDVAKAKELINNWNPILLNELKTQDPGVNISILENTENVNSVEIKNLVESSTNLGVVTTEGNKVEFDSAIRSSVASLKDEIVLRSKTIAELIGADFETTAGYPEWQYDNKSKVRGICQDVYKRMYGKDAKIVAIHAGVECGLFNEKL